MANYLKHKQVSIEEIVANNHLTKKTQVVYRVKTVWKLWLNKKVKP